MKYNSLNKLILSPLLALLTACGPLSQDEAGDSSQLKIVDPAIIEVDVLGEGPFEFEELDYNSGAFMDNEVLPPAFFGSSNIAIDIRGRLYLPKRLDAAPLIVFLHGNHATCGISTGPGNPRLDISTDFTFTGRCPSGQVEAPSHLGYDYTARQLASHGYAVISINANRGITGRNSDHFFDPTLVYARGVHVLKHLERFYQWSKSSSTVQALSRPISLANRIDFTQVGLVGHSRGGEGMRHAYNIAQFSQDSTKWRSRIPGLGIRAIFEIAPVDVGTQNQAGGFKKVDAVGIPWTVVIPGCDLDVMDFSGANPFARMLEIQDSHAKAVFTIWGANHNFFNSEWQVSDAPHQCPGFQEPLWDTDAPDLGGVYAEVAGYAKRGVTGSLQQQAYAKGLIYAFFRAHLGSNKDSLYERVFDPQYYLPQQLSEIAPSKREYVRPQDRQLILKPHSDLTLPVTRNGLRLETVESFLSREFVRVNTALKNYAAAHGYGRWEAVRYPNTYVRPSLAVSLPELTQNVDLELSFPERQDMSRYWTIDLSLAQRSGCYYGEQSCEPPMEALDFEIALIAADGSRSQTVLISDYAALENRYTSFFEADAEEAASGPGGTGRLYYRSIPLLFQTVRIEISDFDFAGKISNIRGLELRFGPNQKSTLFISEVSLSRKPGQGL